MTFEQASKIGTNLDGYVKCTFAELHSPTGGKLFSIQHAAVENAARVAFNAAVSAANPNVDGTVYLTKDIPVVVATGELSPDGKWAKCTLTENARTIINNQILKGWRSRKGRGKEPSTFSRGEAVYVKTVAIDWIPTDINAVEIIGNGGVPVRLTDALAAAKKRLDQAKAILAATATITII